jgi:hypothetical protein
VLRHLRELRADIDQRFEAAELRFRAIERRLDGMHQAIIGESAMGRYTVAEVEEQLAAIRDRLNALEAR